LDGKGGDKASHNGNGEEKVGSFHASNGKVVILSVACSVRREKESIGGNKLPIKTRE